MKTRHFNKEHPLQPFFEDEQKRQKELKKRQSEEIIAAKRHSQNLIKESLGSRLLDYLVNLETEFPGILVYLCTMNETADETDDNAKKSRFASLGGRLFMDLEISVRGGQASTDIIDAHHIDNAHINNIINERPEILQEIENYVNKISPFFTEDILNKLFSDRRSLVHNILPTNWISTIYTCLDKSNASTLDAETRTPAEVLIERNKVINHICGAILFRLIASIPTIKSHVTKFATGIWDDPSSTTHLIIDKRVIELKKKLETMLCTKPLTRYLKKDKKLEVEKTLLGLQSSFMQLNPSIYTELFALQEKGISTLLNHFIEVINNQSLNKSEPRYLDAKKQLKRMMTAYVKQYFDILTASHENASLTLKLLESCITGIRSKRMLTKLANRIQAQEKAKNTFQALETVSFSLSSQDQDDSDETTISQKSVSSSSYSKSILARTLSASELNTHSTKSGTETSSSDYSARRLHRRQTERTLKRQRYDLAQTKQHTTPKSASNSRETSPPASPTIQRHNHFRKTENIEGKSVTPRETAHTPSTLFTPAPIDAAGATNKESLMIFSTKRK